MDALTEVQKLAMVAVWLAIPVVVIGWGNTFRSRRRTILRSLAALAVSWMWLFWSSMTVTKLDLAVARSEADVVAITHGDGARQAFALLLGWVPSLVVVAAAWAGFRVLGKRRELRSSEGSS